MPVVSAHGIAVHSEIPGATARLEKVMQNAILQANAAGISNEEKDALVMRRRMRIAYLQEYMVIVREQFEQQREALHREFEEKIRALRHAHDQHRENLYEGWRAENERMRMELDELERQP